jgi:Holliday junction resolvase-like predicted endonuclease
MNMIAQNTPKNKTITAQLRALIAEPKVNAVGIIGEMIAAEYLRRAGCRVQPTEQGSRRGDLRVITPAGELLYIEVKTARRGKDNKWRFTLIKTGHTDHRATNAVLLLAVTRSAAVVPFIIPTPDIRDRRHIVITSNPRTYAGKFAAYRTTPAAIGQGVLWI